MVLLRMMPVSIANLSGIIGCWLGVWLFGIGWVGLDMGPRVEVGFVGGGEGGSKGLNSECHVLLHWRARLKRPSLMSAPYFYRCV